jgi:ADP-dependent phosphofructokinase/glucokinase
VTAAEHLAAAIALVADDARKVAGHPVHGDTLRDALRFAGSMLATAAAELGRVNGRLVKADL